MRKLIGLLVIMLGFSAFNLSVANLPEEEGMQNFAPVEKSIEVYYFHYSRRCATCVAVEDETNKALEEYFKASVDDGTIIFLSIDIEEESNSTLVDTMEISGQTLIFVSDDDKVDLTNDAFMNARTKPEKFRKQVKKTVEKMME